MKTVPYFLILIFFAAAAPLKVQALCNRIYFVGTNTDAVSKNKSGINLLSIDVYNELKKRIECVYNERTITFTRAAEELRNNHLDIFAFAFTNDEWTEFSNPLPIYSVERLLLVQKKHYKKGLNVQDYLADPKIKFSNLAGGSFFASKQELAKLEKSNRVIYNSFPDGVLELFVNGKVQAMFTSPIFLRRYDEQYKIKSKAEVIADPSATVGVTIYFSKKRVSPLELKTFEKAIQEMKADGTLKKIILKYVDQDDFDKYYHL